MLSEPAPAKVNLFLHVLGRRADGYHLLDSVVVFPGPGDVLHAELADRLSLEIVGPFAPGLSAGPDNLVLRAAAALAPGRGARLVLDKRVPIASGIGGGSADAAAALRLLSRMWGVAPGFDAVVGLGADVAVCMESRSARMGGAGELIGPAPSLPGCAIVLANPGVAVSTAEVFRRRSGSGHGMAALPEGWASLNALAAGLGALHNDLEASAVAICPAVAATLGWLRAQPGCVLARMSGSGATCFGLFETAPAVVAPPGWWVAAGALPPAGRLPNPAGLGTVVRTMGGRR